MATPSSSATSPSPPMAYLQHAPAPQQIMPSTVADTLDQDTRKKAVDKFLARAEVAMVTRRLRAQLAYASYKATHNIPHVPLRDLEAQSQSQAASFNRTIAAKRKAVGGTNHYSNPATQGPSSAGAGSLRRGGSGTMAPPASVSSPRTHPSSITGTPAYSGYDVASSQRNANQAPSLYASILAPPPSKHARTIHNPNDPPVPASSRPTPSPKARAPKASPRAEHVRQSSKSKQSSKNSKVPASPDRRKKKTASIDKGKRKQHPDDMEVDGEMDLKAAATLTSLLRHHHRPSISGSASSPRSSIDGSDVGSAYSYSQFAQSSTRTAAANTAEPPVSAVPSASNIVAEPTFRNQTPPPPSGGSSRQEHTTPRAAAPTDNEAASLMLFLATSPSPARPANKDSKDSAAFRALGGPLRSKGRVLFPSTSATDPAPSGSEDASATSAGTSYRSPALSRGGDSSFASSISSIGPELGGSRTDGHSPQGMLSAAASAVLPSPAASAFVAAPSPSHLLPPAPLPLPATAPTSPAGRRESNPSSKPTVVGVAGGGSGNPGPGPFDFNFHEFINASPSPSRGAHVLGVSGGGGHKSNLGLRADVGRKLFEEEQMRQAHAHAMHAAAAAMGPAKRQEDRPLGAGIDLVHS